MIAKRLSSVCRTENIFDLVFNKLFDVRTAISNVLTRVKMIRMSIEVLTDTSRHSKAEVRIDVDLADSKACSLTELIFRNTNSISEIAAVVVDDLDILRNNRRSAMKNNRELRETLGNFFEDIETKLRRYENAISVARALFRLEFESAMACADSDCEGVNARALYKFLNLFRLSVGSFMCSDLYIILDTSELAEFAFNDYAMLMGIVNNALRELDVFFEAIFRTINHNGSEAAIDAGFASFEISTMVEMQSDRNIVDLKSSLNEFYKISMFCILSCTSRALEDYRGLQFSSSFRDSLYDFHVVYVESADCVAAFVSFLKHFFCSN